MTGRNDRLLSDADVEAVVDQLEARMVSRFYGNVGRGVWGWFWKAAVGLAMLAAAYGAGGGSMLHGIGK